MSIQEGNIVSRILLERFGSVVQEVGVKIYRSGPSSLAFLRQALDLPLSKIKDAICVLYKFNLVKAKLLKNNISCNYSLISENVLLMLRYPRYVMLIKIKFGDEAEIILEEILQNGYLTASDIILRTHKRLETENNKTISVTDIRDKFEALVIAKYICRVSPYQVYSIPLDPSQQLYEVPKLEIKLLIEKLQGTNHTMPDANIFWKVDFDRFHQDMRDKLIENAISRKFDENVGQLMKVFLQQMYLRTDPWADYSNPVPVLEVKEIVRRMTNNPELIAFFDQYMTVLEQDNNNVIRKVGAASGGSFQINLKEIITQLTWDVIEQVVLEKFDSKTARIFRLVRLQNFIEPEQVQKLAMISNRETKQACFQLFEENFFVTQELKKTGNNSGPLKSFTLFGVNLPIVVRMVLEMCYKTLFNMMTRRQHEAVVNKRIIDKKQRVDTIALSMKSQGATDEQLADIEEMITPPERELLDIIQIRMKKLSIVEIELDDTIFLLQLFLMYI